MPNNFNPHLQAAVLEVVENQLVEQRAVAVFINKKNTERHTLCAQMEAQSATLTAYRKSLIHECVTGRRRITEADVSCSRLSAKTGQLNREPYEINVRLKTTGGDRPELLCRPDQSPAMNTEDLL